MQRQIGRAIWGPAIGLITALAGAAAVGFSTGAPGGFTGGPVSGGQSCSLCHFAQTEGIGSVQILNAPLKYQPNGLYELSVRVSDPDKVGAGFSLSAETAGGVFAGAFEIVDPMHTTLDFAEGLFPTHTESGYLRSLGEWENMGNSTTFTVRWRAPQEDVGEVTFYAAGNAVDDMGTLGGDHVYTTNVAVAFGGDCPADLDGDGIVGTLDLIMLLNQWRTDGAADITRDGIVDIFDLAELLSDWGACPG